MKCRHLLTEFDVGSHSGNEAFCRLNEITTDGHFTTIYSHMSWNKNLHKFLFIHYHCLIPSLPLQFTVHHCSILTQLHHSIYNSSDVC